MGPSAVAKTSDYHGELVALLPQMRGFARFLVRDRAGADDLVQDAMVRALASGGQFAPGTDLRAWVFAILRNRFRETLRRSRTERRLIDENVHDPDVIEPEVHWRGDITDLQQAIWRLSPALREAIILVGAQELSYEEAAVICKVPVGTMKARVSRARATLATLMATQPAP